MKTWSFTPLRKPDDGTGSGGDPVVDPALAAPDPAADPAPAPAPQGETISRADYEREIRWRDREIGRKHGRTKTLEEENAQLRALVEAASRSRQAPAAADPVTSPAPQPQPPYRPELTYRPEPQHDVDRIIEARSEVLAEQKAAARSLEDKLSDAVNRAQAKHGAAWSTAFDRIKQMGGIDADTLGVIAASDAPDEVLYTLGSKPEEFQRIMDLPPARRNTEIIKMGLSASAPAQQQQNKVPTPSNAPAPVDQINSSATSGSPAFSLYDHSIDKFNEHPWEAAKRDSESNDEKWFAVRAKQKAESTGRPWSPRK